jgi:outer membrane receptor protein involved in Fe transport
LASLAGCADGLIAAVPFATAQADSSRLEEVVVTAQRVARPAQSVPISLSALSGEELRKRDW